MTIVLVVLLVAIVPLAVPLVSAESTPHVLNLEPWALGDDNNDPPLPIMPYVAGYDAGDKDTTTRVKITVSFPGTSPSAIPSGNYLAGGMFLQGQESGQDEPWRHTDYGFLASLSLDHNGIIQYNMAFYRTHEPTLNPLVGGWYECVWKNAVVLEGVSSAEPVTLSMEWDNGWIKWFYTINGNTYQAGAYYALSYSGSIIQKFYIGHYHEESGGAADFYYYQFGIYSQTALDTSGWNVRLKHPMYYDDSGNQWKMVSKARSTLGTQSYIDHWWRWGGLSYPYVGARCFENGMLQEEYVVEFYGADGALTHLNWLLWGRNMDWFSPTGHSDPDGGWYDPYETRAYDDNENTYALTEVTKRNRWSKFLYLTRTPEPCRKIRILNKDATPSNQYYHDIDVYKDGTWVGVYYGSGIGTTWEEISFDVGVVSEMRIRVKRLTGPDIGVVMRISEADFGALIEEDWFSPTGHSDPDGGWFQETRAYDNNEDTYAKAGYLHEDAWSEWLYLTHSPITCNRIRILNKESLEHWDYRKSHVIYSASGAGTNYQVRIVCHYGSGRDDGEDVYLNGHCQPDFDDIRFTDDDKVTLLEYWMEEKADYNYAIFWVEIQDDLSSQDATIYLYYGNDAVSSASNGANTFLLFYNFDYSYEIHDFDSEWYRWVGNGNPNRFNKIYDVATGNPDPSMKMDAEFAGAEGTGIIFVFTQVKTKGGSELVIETDFRAKSNTAASSVTNAYLYVFKDETLTSSSVLWWHALAAGGTTDTGWQSSEQTTTGTSSESTVKIGFGGRDAWGTNWGQLRWFDNIRVRKHVSSEPEHGSWGQQRELPSVCYDIWFYDEYGYWHWIYSGPVPRNSWIEIPFYACTVLQMKIRVKSQGVNWISTLHLYEADFGLIP